MCVIMVLLASIFALTILANELSKDSKVTDDALVVSGTNNMVQTAAAFTHEIPLHLLSLVDQEHLELLTTLQFGGNLVKPNGEEFPGTQLTFNIDTIIKINETSILLYAGANKIQVDKGDIEITLADNQGSMSEVCGRCSMMKVVTEESDYIESLAKRAEELGFEVFSETERRRLWNGYYGYLCPPGMIPHASNPYVSHLGYLG